MHPEICTIGPFTVYSYGVMLAVAFLVGVWLARKAAVRQGMDPEVVFNACFIGVFAGIAGARALYVAEHHSLYLRQPLEIFMLQHGGLSFFGGLIAGPAAAAWYLKAKKQAFWRTIDLLSPYLALGHAIGRIGCLLNGCCYGKPAAWGMYFPVHDEVLIPTQLFESLALLGIFLALRLIQERKPRTGTVSFSYLLMYSLVRFFMEFLRADNYPVAAGLTFFQLFSIAGFIVACAGLAAVHHPKKR